MKQYVKIAPAALALYGGSLIMGDKEMPLCTMDSARVAAALVQACGGIVEVLSRRPMSVGITSVRLGRRLRGGCSVELLFPQPYCLFELGGHKV